MKYDFFRSKDFVPTMFVELRYKVFVVKMIHELRKARLAGGLY